MKLSEVLRSFGNYTYINHKPHDNLAWSFILSFRWSRRTSENHEVLQQYS